ncbi:TPA: LamG domain-containing protein [Candidatus Poribacteria bacterium]|nr:LamG domain-containing protein [Candidatus Poribacteria bacterium]HIA67241.1 LamG domain-containing protein [Candidatus Poribacteria bacterium]
MFGKNILTVVCVIMPMVASAWFTNMANAGAVTSGLIAYWSFDKDTVDIGKGTVEDVWGDSDGEIRGDPKVVEGKIGEGLLLDGDVDFVLVGSKTLNRDYSGITLESWAYINALDDSYNRIMTLDERATAGTTNNEAMLIYDDDDDRRGFIVKAKGKAADPGNMVPGDIPTEEWIHLMGVWDGKTAKYYENGELKGDYSFPGTIEGGNLTLGIGDRSDGCNCDTIQGVVDEVRIYERALSEAEVKQNYRAEGLAVMNLDKLSLTWGGIKSSRL